MKKLLSLLSVLTISGSAVPTTIAASPYKKEETIKNIDSNYQQTNNLENLNREKRDRSKRIFQLNEKLIINQNNPQEYRNSFNAIIGELVNNNILRIIFDNSDNNNWGENSRIFSLNFEEYGYFRIPVEIRWEQNGESIFRNLELVLRTDNLYLQGFIVNVEPEGGHTGPIYNYYHFDFSNIDKNKQPQGVRDGSVPLLETISGIQSVRLTGISPDYRDLLPENNPHIYWSNIFLSFLQLVSDINVPNEHPLGNLARSLSEVILMTSEALRFRSIYARIITHLVNRNEYLDWEFNQNNEIYRILVNWGADSRGNYFQRALVAYNNNNNNRNLLLNISAEDNTRFLDSRPIQVIIGNINFLLNQNNQNCKKHTRDLTNTYWHQKFCDLKQNIDKIEGKINVFEILENYSSENPFVKKGDIFLGTTNGFYSINKNGSVEKRMSTIEQVKSIILNGNDNAYIINEKYEIYNLNFKRWDYKKIATIQLNNKVNVIRVLNEEPDEGSHIVKGAIYIGTDNGVYFVNGDQVSSDNPKIERFELNVIVNDIILDHKGSAYVIDNAGKKYHLNLHGWGYTEVND